MNLGNVNFTAAYGTSDQLPASTLPEICFSGRSNVGKSSLLNKITGRKNLARVSTKPGKTVTVNFYSTAGAVLVDLPGYGYAKVSDAERLRWADLMESYFRTGRNIAMVFQLIDMRREVSQFDMQMIEFLRDAEIPFTVVLTKSDKLNKTEYLSACKNMEEILGNGGFVPFSSLSGDGVEKIRAIIEGVTQ